MRIKCYFQAGLARGLHGNRLLINKMGVGTGIAWRWVIN